MRVPNLDSYSGMHDRTKLSIKDVHVVFGYKKSLTGLKDKIKRGSLPKPEGCISRLFMKAAGPYWTLGSLRKIRAQMVKNA